MTSVAAHELLPTPGSPAAGTKEARRGRSLLTVVAAGQAVAYGLSPLFDGYYDLAVWGIICLATLAALLTLVLTAPVRLTAPAIVALAGLVGLAAWSGLSVLWAESGDSAWTEANRLAFYVASFSVSLWCIRSVGSARAVVAALAGALGVVVIDVAVRLLSGASEFVAFRLTEPLGYVNGMAGSLMMAVWVFLGLTHWPRLPSVLSGAAVALATLSGCLLVLTQSRAVVPAIVASAVVLFAFAPQRVPRAWALIVVCGAIAAALPTLLDVYQQVGERASPSDDVVRRAGLAAIAVSLAAGAVWAAATAISSRVTSKQIRVVARVLATAIPIGAAVVGLAFLGNPIDRAKRGYDDFTSPRVVVPTNTRYASLSGTRYDVWRVAWSAFGDHRLRGLGAGNFPVIFAARRHSPEYVRNPHSIELQALSELGVVGGVLFLVFVGAACWPILRRRRVTIASVDVTAFAVGTGVISVWLFHTSVDWLYNLPGVTGVALLGFALLLARPQPVAARPPRRGNPYSRWLLLIAAVPLVALAAGSVGRALAADIYLRQARSDLPSRPDLAIRDAGRSLDLNPEAMSAYYASAAASARLGDYRGARDSLLEATGREPSNYVPWALLGDLETRRGNAAQARAAYAKASRLSPFDPELRRLAGRLPGASGPSGSPDDSERSQRSGGRRARPPQGSGRRLLSTEVRLASMARPRSRPAGI